MVMKKYIIQIVVFLSCLYGQRQINYQGFAYKQNPNVYNLLQGHSFLLLSCSLFWGMLLFSFPFSNIQKRKVTAQNMMYSCISLCLLFSPEIFIISVAVLKNCVLKWTVVQVWYIRLSLLSLKLGSSNQCTTQRVKDWVCWVRYLYANGVLRKRCP